MSQIRELLTPFKFYLNFVIKQGFGYTENDQLPTNALEAEVKVISNEECYDKLHDNISNSYLQNVRRSLYNGVNGQILCALGIIKTVNGKTLRTVSPNRELFKISTSVRGIQYLCKHFHIICSPTYP